MTTLSEPQARRVEKNCLPSRSRARTLSCDASLARAQDGLELVCDEFERAEGARARYSLTASTSRSAIWLRPVTYKLADRAAGKASKLGAQPA